MKGKGANRCGEKAEQLRYFINSLREVMRKDKLYGDGDVRDVERFYVPAMNTDGRKPLRRNSV